MIFVFNKSSINLICNFINDKSVNKTIEFILCKWLSFPIEYLDVRSSFPILNFLCCESGIEADQNPIAPNATEFHAIDDVDNTDVNDATIADDDVVMINATALLTLALGGEFVSNGANLLLYPNILAVDCTHFASFDSIVPFEK